MAYIRSVLALKRTLGAATVKYFRPRLCPAGATLDKGVPRTWDATLQTESKERLVGRSRVTEVRQPPQQENPSRGLPGAKGPAMPCLTLDRFQPWTTKVRAKQTYKATREPASLRKDKTETHTLAPNHPQSWPQSPHSQPDPDRPQLTVVAVHRRHGPAVSRFRAKQPKTGAGAETSASLKANQRLRRLWTSVRKATDVSRSAVPRPRPSRWRAFGAL